MQILLEIEDIYGEAYNRIARSHGMSRRAFIAEHLREAADHVPGLIDQLKAEMTGPIKLRTADVAIRPYQSPLIHNQEEPLKRYRFTYLDNKEREARGEEGYIEGVGHNAGEAIEDATGHKWHPNDYAKEFRSPQTVGLENTPPEA
jgi:hypothetical protein